MDNVEEWTDILAHARTADKALQQKRLEGNLY